MLTSTASAVCPGMLRVPQPFVVQLRSLATHRTLEGVRTYDIGPKMGYNTMDNGAMTLDGVRVPRSALLEKYHSVDRQGRYSAPPHAKVAYAAMTWTRCAIVGGSGYYLGAGVAIAVRYANMRRQFQARGDGDGAETLLLDYKIHQSRLLPLLATCFAYSFVGQYLYARYDEIQAEMNSANENNAHAPSSNFKSLQELHILTSGLKALTTRTVADGLEDCRKCCGGNGYAAYSGFPALITEYLPACTYEGDNMVLHMQVARVLVKLAAAVQRGGPGATSVPESCAYLAARWQETRGGPAASEGTDGRRPESLLMVFQRRAAAMVNAAARRVHAAGGGAAGEEAACNELIRASVAHNEAIVLAAFADKLLQEAPRLSAGGLDALRALFFLYGSSLIVANPSDFLETLSTEHLNDIRAEYVACLGQVRDIAGVLVSEFQFSDDFLNSCLIGDPAAPGDIDAVYRSMFDTLRLNPMNEVEVADGIQEYMKPFAVSPSERPRL